MLQKNPKANNQQALLAAIVEASDDAIISKQLDGTILTWNPAAEKLFGHAATEAVGQHIALIIPPALLDDETKIIAKIANGETVEHYVTQRMHKNGALLDISLSISPLRDDDGKVVGAAKILRDISNLKKNEELSRRLASDLQEMTRVACHDLRAPLRDINQLARWIREDLEQDLAQDIPATCAEKFDLIASRTQRMEKLLDDIAAYSDAHMPSTDRLSEIISVSEMVQGVLKWLSPPPDLGITLSPLLATARVRSMPLTLVFVHLIENAIRHNDKADKKISVEVEDQGDHYMFSVADNGPGIAPQYHEKVFGMFQTLKPRDVSEGSGMGLALTRKILLHAGQKIWIESTPEAGVKFHFTWQKQLS